MGNNPIKYNDPSGHCPGSDCGDPRDYDDCWYKDENGDYHRDIQCQVYVSEAENESVFINVITNILSSGLQVQPGFSVLMANSSEDEDDNHVVPSSGATGSRPPSGQPKSNKETLEQKLNNISKGKDPKTVRPGENAYDWFIDFIGGENNKKKFINAQNKQYAPQWYGELMEENGTVFYRPNTSSGNPAIEINKRTNPPTLLKYHFPE